MSATSTSRKERAEFSEKSVSVLPLSIPGLPQRPQFIGEYVLIPTPDGFMIDGGLEPRAIYAGPAKSSLLYLVKLLDGRRSVTDLLTALPGVPFEDLHKALLLLNSLGLLEESTIDAPCTRAESDSLHYFRRFVHLNKRNLTGAGALARMQQLQLLLVTPDQISSTVAWLPGVLSASGTGSVSVRSLSDLQESVLPSQSDKHIVVAISMRGTEHAWFMQMAAFCSPRGIRWLRVVLDRESNCADIGPFFESHRPCYECFWRVHGTGSSSGSSEPSKVEAAFFQGLVATEIVHLFSEVAPSGLSKGFIRSALTPYSAQQLQVARLPGCNACRAGSRFIGIPDNNSDSRVDVTILYEDYVRTATQSRVFAEPQHDGNDDYARLIRQFKALPSCRQIALPDHPYCASQDALSLLNGIEPGQSAALSIDNLSSLLKISAGLRGDKGVNSKLQRWAPTGGNLGSVELYVLALDVANLETGAYFYQSADHRLAVIQRQNGGITPLELMQRGVRLPGNALPNALIVMTGAYHRVSRKYGPFAYRLVNFDAGVAVTQLTIAAASLGVRAQLAARWADDLIENQLGLVPLAEQCTAVVALFGCSRALPAQKNLDVFSTREESAYEPRTYSGKALQELVELAYRTSRIKEKEIDRTFRTSVPSCNDVIFADNTAARAAPESMAGALPICSVLGDRVTVRDYASTTISRTALDTVLRYGFGDASASRFSVSLNVLALRVEGLQVGLYSYAHGTGDIYLQGPAPSRSQLEQLFVQPSLATAAAIVLITANLASVTSSFGSYGHRLSLLHAGNVAQRLWIAALAIGLSGAIAAGVRPTVARQYLFMDACYANPMLAFALGAGNRSNSGKDNLEGGGIHE